MQTEPAKEDLAVVMAEWLERTGASLHVSARVGGLFLIVVHVAATGAHTSRAVTDLDDGLRSVMATFPDE
jgi:cytochrome b561